MTRSFAAMTTAEGIRIASRLIALAKRLAIRYAERRLVARVDGLHDGLANLKEKIDAVAKESQSGERNSEPRRKDQYSRSANRETGKRHRATV